MLECSICWSGWKMTHVDGQPGLVGQLLKLVLPGAHPFGCPTRIRRDLHGVGVGVQPMLDELTPPRSATRVSPSRSLRAMIVASGRTESPCPPRPSGNHVRPAAARSCPSAAIPARHGVGLEVPDQLLLLRVDRSPQKRVGECRIGALNFALPFPLLTVCGAIAPVPQLMQQPADGRRTHSPPLSSPEASSPLTSCMSSVRRRCAARQRPFQGSQQTRLPVPATCGPCVISRGRRLPGQTRGTDDTSASPPCRWPQTRPAVATALIQYRRHRRVLGDNRGLQFHVALPPVDDRSPKMAS